ncbi:MAG: NADH-quinone oxidoreductase subunit M [Bryobacteraceae bacterium]|nr:NADH-quinone oxidoreductase subunit M [Bryobacteraceae bacterium]
MNPLLLLLLVPLAGFLVCLLAPKEHDGLARSIALGTAVLALVLSLGLIGMVTAMPTGFQYQSDIVWITTPNIHLHVGVDGISLWMVLLTALLTPLSILASWKQVKHNANLYYAFLLLLEFGVLGVFVSLDLFLYYVFWEISIVPVLFLIGMWGTEKRAKAAVKFFLFTMTGSVLMLAAIIYLYTQTNTFDFTRLALMTKSLPMEARWLMFLVFFLAFAIKTPLFPLHTWLPDTYASAPTPVTVMLAGVLSKMGTYSLLRFCVGLFPGEAQHAAPWVATLAVVSIIYGALIAIVQPNIKRLVAYSSISHLGFVVLGIFAFNRWGWDGSVYQMVNHGISTGALFLLVWFLEDRRGTLEIREYGGVARVAPWLATAFLVTALASIGLPMLGNFVGEFLILQGAAKASFAWAVFASLGVILSAVYMLWMYQRVFFGEISEGVATYFPDLTLREWAVLLPLLFLMVWLGIFTSGLLEPISAANAAMLNLLEGPARVAVMK